MRLIDADAVLRSLPDDLPYKAAVKRVLIQAATVDAVPVVRCEGCKHHRIYLGRDMCARNAQMLDGREVGLRATGKDGFCSYGERGILDDLS